jgi:hypothetical protein
MGGACSMYGTDEKCVLNSESLKGRDHLGEEGVDGRIILNWILKK